jgi:flavin-dependent dehydrogenase
MDARLRVFDGGYVGIAPVPGGRVNIGIVLGPSWRARLAADGASATAAAVLTIVSPTPDDPASWRIGEPCDHIAGASPLGGRVTRRAGPGWFLVGDAVGFLDPFTGEGLHRALVSTELAAAAIRAALDTPRHAARAAGAYDRAMRRRFAAKDAVSWLVQAFLSRPSAFEYAARRLAARPDVRATMGLVMGDLVPASRGLDPRFLASVLAP